MEEGVDLTQQIAGLRQLTAPALVERYRGLFGKEPRVKHSKEWLWKRIAWKLQEEKYGGLSDVAKRRLEELIAEIDLPLGESRRTVTGTLKRSRPARPGDPALGTTLVREWRGKQIQVRVLENGFEYEGVVHRSLSAVAKAITGSHWNGRLFFGLTGRKRAK